MKELVHRINYFTTAFVSVLGFSLIAEIFHENDLEDKIDDILMLLLGFGAILWYKKTGHKINSSVSSVVILLVAVLVKIVGVYIERADPDALGDDIGVLSALVVALIFVIWQTVLSKKRTAE